MSKELLYNQLYERTKDFGRTQFIKELMRLERENQKLKEQLKYYKSKEIEKFNKDLLQLENDYLESQIKANIKRW